MESGGQKEPGTYSDSADDDPPSNHINESSSRGPSRSHTKCGRRRSRSQTHGSDRKVSPSGSLNNVKEVQQEEQQKLHLRKESLIYIYIYTPCMLWGPSRGSQEANKPPEGEGVLFRGEEEIISSTLQDRQGQPGLEPPPLQQTIALPTRLRNFSPLSFPPSPVTTPEF